MPALSQVVSLDVVRQRVAARLRGGSPRQQGPVVWTDRGAQVLVHPDSLALRLTRGWLVARVELETDQTGRAPVTVVFFLGRGDQGAGLRAATTLDMADPDGLLTRWGRSVQAAVWDGVLDALEAATGAARDRQPAAKLRLSGFTTDGERLEARFRTEVPR
jgi:hypothetical protein